MSAPNQGILIGVSLKMYFSPNRTLEWSRAVRAIANQHPALRSGHVQLLVLPSFPMIKSVVDVFAGSQVRVGAQDLFWEDRGAFTGEVSGLDLRDLGCSFVEVGHIERRTLFHEDDLIVRQKTEAAMRHGLSPVLCVGEPAEGSPEHAVLECIRQLESAFPDVHESPSDANLVVAYEPGWAIGGQSSANPAHVASVVSAMRLWLSGRPDLAGSRIIYGGSAGPGLLSSLGNSVDGLFLGRFVHDPSTLESILDESMAVL